MEFFQKKTLFSELFSPEKQYKIENRIRLWKIHGRIGEIFATYLINFPEFSGMKGSKIPNNLIIRCMKLTKYFGRYAAGNLFPILKPAVGLVIALDVYQTVLNDKSGHSVVQVLEVVLWIHVWICQISSSPSAKS